uniref:uncharacterized protein LOC122593872 n=1 Tax=Erigeron canadensis TaxID=72917 RepID=UPI001CB9506F|nr:uncharacterized protein LOC122593872 [Erigeron canadensis]
MDGISSRVYKGVKGYWRRRRYQRLGRNTRDESGYRKKRFWQIKITRKLKLRLKLKCSPKKLLIKMRDGYVRMMMRVANSPGIIGSVGYGYNDRISSFGARPVKEYDEKMIIEIYKVLAMRQAHLVPVEH